MLFIVNQKRPKLGRFWTNFGRKEIIETSESLINTTFIVRGLAAICKEGRCSISTTLQELERHGYLERNQLRDERGRITDTEYIIYEKPRLPSPCLICSL